MEVTSPSFRTAIGRSWPRRSDDVTWREKKIYIRLSEESSSAEEPGEATRRAAPSILTRRRVQWLKDVVIKIAEEERTRPDFLEVTSVREARAGLRSPVVIVIVVRGTGRASKRFIDCGEFRVGPRKRTDGRVAGRVIVTRTRSLFRFRTVSLAPERKNGAQKCTKVVRERDAPGTPGARGHFHLLFLQTAAAAAPSRNGLFSHSPLRPLPLAPLSRLFTCLHKLRERARIARSVHTCIYLWRHIKITVRALRHVNCRL